MRRLLPIEFLLLFMFVMAGCVRFPVKTYSPALKTNEVFISEIKTYQGPKLASGGIKDIGLPTNNEEIAEEFRIALSTELEKSGFLLLKQPKPESLVIKIKIGDRPAPLGGWLGIMAMGVVVVDIEVYQSDRLVLHLEDGMNTGVGYSSEKQITRLAPRIVKKLKENL